MTRYVNKGHFARAALEATAYQTREVLDAMQTDSDVELTTLKVDGGMVVNQLLMQFQADVLKVPIVRPEMIETTALGSAYLAGLAEGVWSSPADVTANWASDGEFTPNGDRSVADAAYARWQRAVERSRNWELDD